MDDDEADPFIDRFHSDPETRPVLDAVLDNDLEAFKRLTQDENASFNYDEYFIYKLIKFLIYTSRLEMFKSYVTLENCWYHDKYGKTYLMALTTQTDEIKVEFAKALVAVGANVNATDFGGDTCLHFAAWEHRIDNTKLVELMLENGANINARDDCGQTPLWAACIKKNYSFLHMMLHHGADPTIPNNTGILPLAVLRDNVHQDILFDYTFDEKTTVQLGTLTEAMLIDNDLFNRIVDMTEDVDYDKYMIRNFARKVKKFVPEHLKLFLKNFTNVVEEISNTPLLVPVLKYCDKTIIDAFLQTPHCATLIQAVRPPHSLISDLIKNLKNEEDITEIIYVLLSYGLEVTSRDMDIVYERYGFCELFRILLHMDITILKEVFMSPARVYYDLKCDVENFSKNPLQASRLLQYYNNYKLKEAFLSVNMEHLNEKVNALPEVPCLVQLSRDAARKHLVSWYAIENSRQFYTVLKALPIVDIYKKILGLERKLY